MVMMINKYRSNELGTYRAPVISTYHLNETAYAFFGSEMDFPREVKLNRHGALTESSEESSDY